MPIRIGQRQPYRVYLAAWREKLGLTQKQLAERLGVSDMTVSRWETGASQLNGKKIPVVEEALGISAGALLRHPDQPSADELLARLAPEVRQEAIDYLTFLAQRRRA